MFFLQLLLVVALLLVAYFIAPKSKQAKKDPVIQENPTADAGSPIPVVFGTILIKSPNILWYGEKKQIDSTVTAKSQS